MEVILQGTLISAIIMMLLVILDTVTSVSIAVYKGEFDWKFFLNFLIHNISPYIIIWAGFSGVFIGTTYLTSLLGYAIGLTAIIPITGIISIVAGAISVKLVADMYAKFKQLGIDISNARARENDVEK